MPKAHTPIPHPDYRIPVVIGGQWANPFTIGLHGTRDEVIAKYRAHLLSRPDLMAALPELRGKDLACWCAPQRCHGEVLIELANANPPAALHAYGWTE